MMLFLLQMFLNRSKIKAVTGARRRSGNEIIRLGTKEGKEAL